ncbi:hypothetical protein QJQ45_023609 [Haematococcus lacustris]|nr:hypothetical protein QJQ45_023609 [Haematococcus lacustris]
MAFAVSGGCIVRQHARPNARLTTSPTTDAIQQCRRGNNTCSYGPADRCCPGLKCMPGPGVNGTCDTCLTRGKEDNVRLHVSFTRGVCEEELGKCHHEGAALAAIPNPALKEYKRYGTASVQAPLTAKSTVTSACNTGRNEVKPIQAVGPHQQGSTLERRNKVPLEKGYSQVDWMRLAKATPAPILRKDITVAEVRQHKTADDAWMIFRNKVYNIGPYLRFHPGGSDILLKVAGRDGTSLFMKYHPWVAISSLMERHLVGLLAQDPTPPPAKPAHAAAAAGADSIHICPTATFRAVDSRARGFSWRGPRSCTT